MPAYRQYQRDYERGAVLRSPAAFEHWLRTVLKGMSQRELARLSGVNHSTISKLAAGKMEPSLSTANALLGAVHVYNLLASRPALPEPPSVEPMPPDMLDADGSEPPSYRLLARLREVRTNPFTPGGLRRLARQPAGAGKARSYAKPHPRRSQAFRPLPG